MSTINTEKGVIHTSITPSSLRESVFECLRQLNADEQLLSPVSMSRADIDRIDPESIEEAMVGISWASDTVPFGLWHHLPDMIQVTEIPTASVFQGDYHAGKCDSDTCTVGTTHTNFSVQTRLRRDLAETDLNSVVKKHLALSKKEKSGRVSKILTGLSSKDRQNKKKQEQDERLNESWVEITPSPYSDYIAGVLECAFRAPRLKERFPLYDPTVASSAGQQTLKLGEEYLLDVLCLHTKQIADSEKSENQGSRVPITFTIGHQEQISQASADDSL